MPTPIFACGGECGAVPGHWTSVTGAPSISTSVFRSGARSIRFNLAAAACDLIYNHADVPTIVVRIYFRFDTLPNTDNFPLIQIPPGAGNVVQLRYITSGTNLRMDCSTSTVTGPVVVTGRWYRVDIRANFANTGVTTVDWQVDGVEQGQVNFTQTNTNAAQFRLGTSGTTTMDLFWDDVLLSATAADYPLGDGYVKGYMPDATGTHSFTTGDFQDETSTNIATSNTTSWSRLDELPIGVTDFVKQVVVRTAGYVEYQFAGSVEALAPRAVQASVGVHAITAASAGYVAKLNDGGTLDDIAAAPTIATTTLGWISKCYATKPSGGDWTEAAFNALRMRWGYSGDVTPNPALDGIILEAEFSPLAGRGPTVTRQAVQRAATW